MSQGPVSRIPSHSGMSPEQRRKQHTQWCGQDNPPATWTAAANKTAERQHRVTGKYRTLNEMSLGRVLIALIDPDHTEWEEEEHVQHGVPVIPHRSTPRELQRALEQLLSQPGLGRGGQACLTEDLSWAVWTQAVSYLSLQQGKPLSYKSHPYALNPLKYHCFSPYLMPLFSQILMSFDKVIK